MGKMSCTGHLHSSPLVKDPYSNCVLGTELFCTQIPTNRGRRVCMKANRARRVRLGAAPLGWARCAWVITGAGGCAGGGQAMYGLGQGPVLAVAPPRAAPAVGGPGVSQPSLCAGIPAGRPTARAPVAPRGSGDDGRRGGPGADSPRVAARADSPVGGWELAGGAGRGGSRARPRGHWIARVGGADPKRSGRERRPGTTGSRDPTRQLAGRRTAEIYISSGRMHHLPTIYIPHIYPLTPVDVYLRRCPGAARELAQVTGTIDQVAEALASWRTELTSWRRHWPVGGVRWAKMSKSHEVSKKC